MGWLAVVISLLQGITGILDLLLQILWLVQDVIGMVSA